LASGIPLVFGAITFPAEKVRVDVKPTLGKPHIPTVGKGKSSTQTYLFEREYVTLSWRMKGFNGSEK